VSDVSLLSRRKRRRPSLVPARGRILSATPSFIIAGPLHRGSGRAMAALGHALAARGYVAPGLSTFGAVASRGHSGGAAAAAAMTSCGGHARARSSVLSGADAGSGKAVAAAGGRASTWASGARRAFGSSGVAAADSRGRTYDQRRNQRRSRARVFGPRATNAEDDEGWEKMFTDMGLGVAGVFQAPVLPRYKVRHQKNACLLLSKLLNGRRFPSKAHLKAPVHPPRPRLSPPPPSTNHKHVNVSPRPLSHLFLCSLASSSLAPPLLSFSLSVPPPPSSPQVAILEKALARGRRQVPVTQMADDLELSREEVLAWLKVGPPQRHPSTPP